MPLQHIEPEMVKLERA